MKFYAVTDKETGELIWRTPSSLYAYQLEHELLHDVDLTQYDYVTVRVEPEEPCVWCRRGGMLDQLGKMIDLRSAKFCLMCGRPL